MSAVQYDDQAPDRGECAETGKPLLTVAEARRAAKNARRNKRGGRQARVHAFHCRGCDWWHAGGRAERVG